VGDDVVDEGEDVEVPAAQTIDEQALEDEAGERLSRMRANPKHRGDPDLTFSGYVEALFAGRDEALAAALKAAAEQYVAAAKANGIGAIAEKKLLASKLLNGEFDG
jgi:hypothetical protein